MPVCGECPATNREAVSGQVVLRLTGSCPGHLDGRP